MEKDNIKDRMKWQRRPALWILRAVFVLVSLTVILVSIRFARETANEDTSDNILNSFSGLGDLLRPSDKTATFVLDDVVMEVQVLEQQQKVRTPSFQAEEGTYYLWKTKKGEEVTFPVEISKNTTYYATRYSLFNKEIAFLIPDENGLIYPDHPVSTQDLCDVLHLVLLNADIRADWIDKVHTSDLNGNAELTVGQVLTLMSGLAPEKVLVNAFSALDIDQKMTRRELAAVITKLRGKPETVIFDQLTLPRDIDISADDAEILLLSSMDYHEARDGQKPLEAILQNVQKEWEPGFHLIGGDLFYAEETGKLLTAGSVGVLQFGEDGRYTSGDAELDAMVRNLIIQFIQDDPQATREELLYDAFIYTRDSIYYVNRAEKEYGELDWQNEEGKSAIQTGTGNCYNYAGMFCVLARALGYQMKVVSGIALAIGTPHGWCVCEIDNEPYIFDPELAVRAETGFRDNWGYDMFKIEQSIWPSWLYIGSHLVTD